MNKKIIIILFLTSFCFNTYAQNTGKDNIVGTSYTISSKIMKEERAIEIFLPDGYAASDKKYPVLYVLDGQRYFLHAVSLLKSFKDFKQTPDFIIVGISKNPTDRNRIYSVNSKNYLDFLKKEVVELVDAQFRTTENRLLFGWAFGGGFVLETMTAEPQLFDAYIAASPFPLARKIPEIDSLITNAPVSDKLLFFTSGTNEGVVKEGTYQLNNLLTEKATGKINWVFKELEGEEHRSTPFTTLYHGIRQYYHYYPELQFSNLEEFINAGGLDFVYDYYEKRALKYGFPKELSDWTMFSITRNAIRADDFAQFDSFVNEFKKTNFISRLRVSRACLVAAYYLQNDQYEKALDLYTHLVELHPNAEAPLYGLGDTYKKLKKEKEADLYYKKAKKLAQENN